ncbi:conserved unknown protein [Ectocarpus siliculosus]|uniref:Uncharacterized protein n=1 Tax=Ectocarpus siliculosus TaxID=2880 RepID=D7G7G3_ECTSI|nr:conserved unknown protein [Ectocarpus siliculosus]|eukprot:CBJ27705.1 conserved unknown protein [Ectocarpus siliculosus]
MSGKAGAVGVLIEAGLDIETKRSEDGSGPLHHATKAGNDEVVHALLHHGASVDANNNAGQTPLHWAMKSATTLDKVAQTAKLLTEWGANVEAADDNGNTPISLARKGRPQLLGAFQESRKHQSWCHRRQVILFKRQVEREQPEPDLGPLLLNLANTKEELFEMVLGYL